MRAIRFAVAGIVASIGLATGIGEAAAVVYCTGPGVPVGCVWNPGGVGLLPGAGAGAAGVGLAPGAGVGANGVGVRPGAGAGAPGVGLTAEPGVGARGVGEPGAGWGPNAGGPVNRMGVR